MAFVTDPDNLDRFQVAVDPVGQTVSVRGLGTIRGAQADTGISNGTTTFEDTTSDQFVSGGVAQGDILTIISGTGVGHYIVQSITDLNTLIVDRAITGTATDLTYKINEPEASTGAAGAEAVADGVTLQALYSFLKEEWRTLDGSLGNAADLIQFTFPLESITREQFEIGGPTHANWNFSDATTENLIRTGGWQVLNVGGTVLADNTGVITLGSLDSDAQVYYQQHAATVDPTDFVLTGVVNQSVNTYNLVTLADTGTGFGVSQTNGSITRNDGGNWGTDGYKVGGLITIIDAEDSTNNGTFSVLDVQDSVDGTIQVSGLGVDNAADTTMQAAVNKRAFLKLFVRKKARTYAGSEIADIGVSTIEEANCIIFLEGIPKNFNYNLLLKKKIFCFPREPNIKIKNWEKLKLKHGYTYNNFYHVVTNPQFLNKNYDFLIDLKYIKKTKNLSAIISNKKNDVGYKLRYNFIINFSQEYPNICDIFGYGWKNELGSSFKGELGFYHNNKNQNKTKFDGLFNYKYSICIENCQKNNYFSEKFTDSILCWTIPIYYGCKNIHN